MLFMLGVVKIDAKAANVIDSGTEDNFTWMLYDDFTMEITGTGDIDLGFVGWVDGRSDSGLRKHKDVVKVLKFGDGITGIKSFVFAFYSSLESVSFSNTITYIGNHSFYDCTSLTNVVIPSSVEIIDSNAFDNCALTSVVIPDSVTEIGNYAFSGCNQLSEVTLPKSITSIGAHAFGGCAIKKIVIPDSVTKLAGFGSCKYLTDVIIPDTVNEILDGAFKGCSNLKNVAISKQLLAKTNLDNCFSESPWLLSQKAPLSGTSNDGNFKYFIMGDGSLTLYGEGAFTGINDLHCRWEHTITTIVIPAETTSIYFPRVIYYDNVDKIINNSSNSIGLNPSPFSPFRPFSNDDNLHSWCDINDPSEPIYEISNGTAIRVDGKLVKHYTVIFDGNKSTSGAMESIKVNVGKSITIPKSKFSKTGYKFSGWVYRDGSILELESNLDDGGILSLSESDLKSLKYTVKLIAQWEKDPYYGVKKDGETIKDAKSKANYIVTSRKKRTVKYSKNTNKNATTITIPASITFDGITYKVTEVSSKALKGNKKATKIKVGKNATKIGDEAFSGCTALTNLTIGSNVTTIGNKAIYNCPALKTLTLPAKTYKFGKQFVGKCKNMKTLMFKSSKITKKTLTDGACSGISNKVTVKVPKAKVSAYTKIFQNKGLGKKVKIKSNK